MAYHVEDLQYLQLMRVRPDSAQYFRDIQPSRQAVNEG